MVLVASLVTTLALSAHADPAAAAGDGRVLIEPLSLALDTRASAPIAANTQTPVSFGGLLQLYSLGRGTAGIARIVTCGTQNAVTQLSVEKSGTALVTFPSEPNLCYSADVQTDVVVHRIGSISGGAQAGRSQFVPATPIVVASGTSTSVSPISFEVAAAPPPGALHAMFRIDVDAVAADQSRSGAIRIEPCGGPASEVTNIVYGAAAASGIAFVPLSATYCATIVGPSTPFTISLVGWLATEGPDPTRVPPWLHSTVVATPPSGLRAITPTRILDTRSGLGAPQARVSGPTGITLQNLPLTAQSTSVVLNMTVTDSTDAGFVTVWPCDVARPTVSNLNFVAGETVANQVTVALGASRTVCAYSLVPTHLVADVTATFEATGGLGVASLTPERILDTRAALGAPPGRVAGGTFVTLQVAGRGGAPVTGIGAVTMNTTVTEPSADGFITVWPCDEDRPTASSLNYVTGQTIPNLVTSKVSAAGTVCLYASTDAHLIADIATAFVAGAATGFDDVVPARILDTRTALGTSPAGKAGTVFPITLQVGGRGGVPASGAVSVTMNVTATEPDGPGYVTVWPCDRARPVVSNLNLVGRVTRPNSVMVQLSPTGTVCLYTTAATHLIADVAGYSTAQPTLTVTTVLS